MGNQTPSTAAQLVRRFSPSSSPPRLCYINQAESSPRGCFLKSPSSAGPRLSIYTRSSTSSKVQPKPQTQIPCPAIVANPASNGRVSQQALRPHSLAQIRTSPENPSPSPSYTYMISSAGRFPTQGSWRIIMPKRRMQRSMCLICKYRSLTLAWNDI